MDTRPDGENSQSTTEQSAFPHPETGELLDSREDFVRAMTEIEARLSPIYNTLRPLREEYVKRYPIPEQPEPRYRTLTQEKVARCPRCGGRVE